MFDAMTAKMLARIQFAVTDAFHLSFEFFSFGSP